MLITKKQVLNRLKKVFDPELNISLIDLGLIYDVKITKNNEVTIIMTLTSMGCPLFELMADPIKTNILKIQGVKEVEIELTFDPPWTVDKMSKKAKIQLGFD